MGESGIGKSEAALELIHRGYRLVSDDVVEIRKISDDTLLGTSPDITRHFIELRGIGIGSKPRQNTRHGILKLKIFSHSWVMDSSGICFIYGKCA